MFSTQQMEKAELCDRYLRSYGRFPGDAAKPRIKPFFTYYGGKYRAAPRYPAPAYDRIVEPFCGAAGYSMLYHDREIVLYDAYRAIVDLWQYLIESTEKDIMALPLIGNSDDLRDMGLDNGARKLIGFNLNNGTTHPCNIPSKWMREYGQWLCFWSEGKKERICEHIHCIAHWVVSRLSYESIDVESLGCCTWFVDPPYHRNGKLYIKNKIDYEHLADWCKSLPGQVIVCEEEGANWLPFCHQIDVQSTPIKGVSTSREVYWTNMVE